MSRKNFSFIIILILLGGLCWILSKDYQSVCKFGYSMMESGHSHDYIMSEIS